MDAVHYEFCLFVPCASQHEHLCMSACIQERLATNSKNQVTDHEFCTVWSTVVSHPYPPLGGDPSPGGNPSPPPRGGGERSSLGAATLQSHSADKQRGQNVRPLLLLPVLGMVKNSTRVPKEAQPSISSLRCSPSTQYSGYIMFTFCYLGYS